MTVIAQTITSQLELGLPVRNSNVKRFHNSTFDKKNLSSCKVVLQLETLLARSFAGRLFASLVVYFAHC